MKSQRKRFLAAAFIGMVVLAQAAAAKEKINPDKLNLNLDVSRLDMEQVRLYQGALQARHCHFFMDALLRAEFVEYQYKKCGEEFYFEPDPGVPFDESKLTAGEKAFYERLKKREAEIKAGQMKKVDGAVRYDPAALVNRSRFPHLEKAAFERLLNTGFVVIPGQHEQLFHVYQENDYYVIPSFITTDSVLQLYHLYFNFSLREIEEKKLLPAAAALSAGMRKKLQTRYDRITDERIRDGLRRAVLYFAIAEDLASPSTATEEEREEESENRGPDELVSPADFQKSPPPGLAPAWLSDFMTQRELILSAQEPQRRGPIMGTVDYTMFKPRGHYTRSRALAQYFRTMMWLGLPGFILDEQYMPLETTLALVYELVHDPRLLQLYDLIYRPTSFYVGPSDDITPALVRQVAEEICGPTAGLTAWVSQKEKIKTELIKRDPTRIKPQYTDDRKLPQVRFMGMRYVPDSEILQRLTHVEYRPFPVGLDLFGVLEVQAALQLLQEMNIQWSAYWPEMKKLQAEFADFTPPGGELNLYWRWLRVLKILNQPPPGAPPFMTTDAWQFKNLHTSLASWAKLRHDTILYTKPGGAECGGGETPATTPGFVEARPDFFHELLTLQKFTSSELKKQKLLTDQLAEIGDRMEELFVFLERVSRKEIKKEPLTVNEFEDIRLFGSRLEYLTLQILSPGEYSTWAEVSGPDRSVAVVADIYTYNDKALEEAVGLADELYVIVEVEGYLYIMRGAVFSYYEFIQPVSERLTDEEWQKKLGSGSAPPRPGWTQKFLHLQAPGKPKEPAAYSSGC